MAKHIAICTALLVLAGTALAQAPAGPAPAAAGPAAATSDPGATPPAGQAAAPSVGQATPPSAGPDTDGAAAPDAEPTVAAVEQVPGGPRGLAGMSILGNQETPTSLVIVPWKSSELGNGIGVSRALDPGIGPVDKDVFMRELRYYEIRTDGGN